MNMKTARMIMAVLLAALMACAPALADGTSLWSLGSASNDSAAEDTGSKSSFFGGAPSNQGSDDIEAAPRETVVMPYEPLPGDDFWYDDEYARLDEYMGSELNLVLPREIDGTQLTMIGGSMMSRACGGDNFEAELPVRSLVIPETYTELAYWAFSDCEALETVICYAPLENLPDSVFSGCTSLREVVFVNGVRNIGGYVFDGCTSLETVYLGDAVESVSDSAFLNMDGSEAFAPDDCITDPALLPDVDALLAAVKSEPLAPAPAATDAPSAPTTATGDVTPFLGTWLGDTLEMDGGELSLSDFGMTMEMTIYSDGTAVCFDGEETSYTTWTMNGDALDIEGMTVTLTDDGRLSMDEDGSRVLFVRGEGAPIEPTETDEPTGTAVPASTGDITPFLGTWLGDTLEMDGQVMDLAELGMTMMVTINADGTATTYDGEEYEVVTWTLDGDTLSIFDVGATLTGDGQLCVADDEASILLSRVDDALPTPTDAPSAPTTATGDITPFLGTWLGDTLEMDGSELSLSDFGMTMEMTIYADGTAVCFDGEETSYTTWTMNGDALDIEGMTVTLTDDGRLSMDEDGSRVLFVRGEGAPIEPTETDEPTETTAPAATGDTDGFVGMWHACYLCTGGLTGDLRETLGLDITLELNGDGSGVLSFGEPEAHSWYQDAESGIVYFGEGDAADMPMALLEEGFLQYGNEAGGYIIFSQDAEAVWDPLVNQPIVIGGTAPAGADASERLERKYVCVNAEVSGYTVDASMLGGEYSLTFHADGTVDFAIAGQELTGLSWQSGTVTTGDGEAEAFVVDYYGSALNAVFTDEGFDMNYFDAMLMHFLPEE
ncbi:MAG: leucine-rich repeat domain-containing protein [Candidatus Fimadaptatus sp.]